MVKKFGNEKIIVKNNRVLWDKVNTVPVKPLKIFSNGTYVSQRLGFGGYLLNALNRGSVSEFALRFRLVRFVNFSSFNVIDHRERLQLARHNLDLLPIVLVPSEYGGEDRGYLRA